MKREVLLEVHDLKSYGLNASLLVPFLHFSIAYLEKIDLLKPGKMAHKEKCLLQKHKTHTLGP